MQLPGHSLCQVPGGLQIKVLFKLNAAKYKLLFMIKVKAAVLFLTVMAHMVTAAAKKQSKPSLGTMGKDIMFGDKSFDELAAMGGTGGFAASLSGSSTGSAGDSIFGEGGFSSSMTGMTIAEGGNGFFGGGSTTMTGSAASNGGASIFGKGGSSLASTGASTSKAGAGMFGGDGAAFSGMAISTAGNSLLGDGGKSLSSSGSSSVFGAFGIFEGGKSTMQSGGSISKGGQSIAGTAAAHKVYKSKSKDLFSSMGDMSTGLDSSFSSMFSGAAGGSGGMDIFSGFSDTFSLSSGSSDKSSSAS